jgi:phosphoenolpyruvate synthase/pyruvate phosphate dikinase
MMEHLLNYCNMDLTTFADLYSYPSQQIRHYFGEKALGLYNAQKIGIHIPPASMISTEMHDQFLKQNVSQIFWKANSAN